MKKLTKIFILFGILCAVALSGAVSLAWLAERNNTADPKVSQATVIRQYFHCGSGESGDPYVITRPIHYYHMVELYQRIEGFDQRNCFFQIGYNFSGDGTTFLVYDYDEFGNQKYDNNGAPLYSDTLNMAYYSGDYSLIPTGTSQHPFDGNFNGNGLTIDNLTIVSKEMIEGNEVGTADLGVFGCVTDDAYIHDTYFNHLTLSLEGASIAFCTPEKEAVSTSHDTNGDGTDDSVYVGYIIGHLVNYVSAQNPNYNTQDPTQMATQNSSPIYNVYVNNSTVIGGTSSGLTSSQYGFIGYTDTHDSTQSVTLQNIYEGLESEGGDGGESWGSSIDMAELFNRITTIFGRAENSSSSYYRHYPTSEEIIGSASVNGIPLVKATGWSTSNLKGTKSSGNAIYYWSAMFDSGTNQNVNTTGGTLYGSWSSDYTYLYGQPATNTTTVTSYTKTGAVLDAYYLYDNGAYLKFDGTTFSGVSLSKSGSKWIPDSTGATTSTENGVTTTGAKYYMMIDNAIYYLAPNGTTGIQVTGSAQAPMWYSNTLNEFYTVIGGVNYYLYYDGTWSICANRTRWAIGDGEGNYLGGSIGEVHNETSEAEGAIWIYDRSAGTFSFMSDGRTYYLAYDGELTVKESTPTVWIKTVEQSTGKTTYHCSISGISYYLLYDHGWKAVAINGTKIGSGSHYLRVIKDLEGNFTITDGTESDATLFQVTTSNGVTTIVAMINGGGYYLSSDGNQLTISDSNPGWKIDSQDRIYRTVSGFSDSIANGNYYLMFRSAWYLERNSGSQIASGTSDYLSISSGAIVNSTASQSAIWQIVNSTNGYKVYTVEGSHVYYLSYNMNPVSNGTVNSLILSDSAFEWKLNNTTLYTDYTGDNLCISYLNQWTLQPETAYYIHDTTSTHYLTYRNTGAVDGTIGEACAWVIKQNNSKWQIYTYIGATKYYLSLVDNSDLGITTTSCDWYLDGKGYYLEGGYYLTYEGGWKVIKMTASIQLHYDKSASEKHYLSANGGVLGDADNATAGSLWYVVEGSGPIYTYIGTTKYYLTYRLETVTVVKSNEEQSTAVDAYRRIVPCISTTNNGNTEWSMDTSNRYYLKIENIKFYLVYDEEKNEWAFEEYGGFQLCYGDSYLTLREYPVNLSAANPSFRIGNLCCSSTSNYQWHLEDGQLFTFVGGTIYYLTYTQSHPSAALISVTDSKPSGTMFSQTQSGEIVHYYGSVPYYLTVTDGLNGYTRVEYIESTGNQIINTGVADAADITVDCDIDAPLGRGSYLYGSTQKNGMMYNGLYSGNPIVLETNYLTMSFSVSSTRIRMTQRIANGVLTVTLNGETKTQTVNPIETTGNLYIFGCNNGSRYFTGGGMKVYSFTIRKNGVIIRDFIPVRRNSDNALGLYDTVNGVFYGNSGSGSFITIDTDQSVIDTITGRGYQVLEYVETDGTQLVDTGVKDGLTISVDCDLYAPTGKGNYMFGSQQNSGGMAYNGLYSTTDKITLEHNYLTINLGNNPRIHMTQTLSGGNRTITVNGSSQTVSAGTVVPQGNLYIFGCLRANGSVRPFNSGMKLFRFTVKDGDTVIRDFYPAVNSIGEIGLYDYMNDVFYLDLNGNSLIAGPSLDHGTESFYLVPSNDYSGISSGNVVMTVTEDTNLTIGNATKNAIYFDEYHQFKITTESSGVTISVTRNGNTYYLSLNDSGSTVSQKGTLSFVQGTKYYWTIDSDNHIYHKIGTVNYYLIYEASKGWYASPSSVVSNFRYIQAGDNKCMALNSSKNGITTVDTFSDSNLYIRWFVENGNKLYCEIDDNKYYLTWSAGSGFGVTAANASSSATAFNIGTNTVSVSYSDFTFYIVKDSSGWNVAADQGATICFNVRTSSSNTTYARYIYFNGSTVSASTSSTIWYFSDATHKEGKICTTIGGKVYFLDTDGSTVSAAYTASPKSFANLGNTFACNISNVYYCVFIESYSGNSYTPTLYVRSTQRDGMSGSIKGTIVSGTTVAKPISVSSSYQISYTTLTSSLNLYNQSGSTITDSYTYLFVFVSPTSLGNGIYSGWLWCSISGDARYIRGKGSFSFSTSKASNRDWFYDSYNRTLYYKENGTGTTYYFKLTSSGVSMTTSVSNVDFCFYPSRSSTLSTSSPTKSSLNSGTYTSGVDPQVITREGSNEVYAEFGSGITSVSATTPTREDKQAQDPNLAKTLHAVVGLARTVSFSLSRTVSMETVTIDPSNIIIIENVENPTVTKQYTTDRAYEVQIASYKRGTYLALRPAYQTDEDSTSGYYSDFRAYYKNSGYIVGGSVSAGSSSGQGDIRVSEYSISNISGSYNKTSKTLTLYTFNDSGTTPVKINDSSNTYVSYERTKADFLSILSKDSSDVYGLHFMDAQVSTNKIMYAESVMINNKTYENYPMPEASIDFQVMEQGYIVLYAGDYYTGGNSCFFSFNRIFRDSTTQEILAIKEISEVYTKPGLTSAGYYIYKFTDGTYTKANGSYDLNNPTTTLDPAYTSTPIFKMKWLTNPTNGREFSNDYVYYFEIPCNKGEFAIGSVEGQNGGYLLYLDVASNGTRSLSYNRYASVSDDPLFTQIGYRSSGYQLNSLLNIAYDVPSNSGDGNFSISVNFNPDDPANIVYDEQYNTTCEVFNIIIINTTGYPMDMYVVLADDDDDVENDYNYRYRVYYNGDLYTDSNAFDTNTGTFFASTGLSLS